MTKVLSAIKAVIIHGNKFLVIRQKIGNKVTWDLPGGKVDYGESPYDTLHREVKEEVCLDIEIIKPIGMWWFFREDGYQIVCSTFLCKAEHTNVNITKNPANEKIEEFKWITKKEFLEMPANETLKKLISELEW